MAVFLGKYGSVQIVLKLIDTHFLSGIIPVREDSQTIIKTAILLLAP